MEEGDSSIAVYLPIKVTGSYALLLSELRTRSTPFDLDHRTEQIGVVDSTK